MATRHRRPSAPPRAKTPSPQGGMNPFPFPFPFFHPSFRSSATRPPPARRCRAVVASRTASPARRVESPRPTKGAGGRAPAKAGLI